MEVKQKLEQLLNEAVENKAFPGAVYAVVTKNKIVKGVVGDREWYPEVVKNTLDTVYDLASLTKVICTTSLMMILLEQGRFRLHDNVNVYLKEFPFNNITIWHLMTHTSGLPEGVYGPKDKMVADDVWNKIMNLEKLLFEPGEKIVYSDINYMLLGKIIEYLTKMPLDKYAKQALFEPLEMHSACFNPINKDICAATEYRDDATMTGYVKGTVHDETAYALGGVAGHAGMFASVDDLINFCLMILNDGMFNGKKVLSKATINELYKVQVKEPSGVIVHPKARCLGWQTKDPASSAGDLVSEKTIIHTGFTGTNVFIDKENEIAFILLTNRVHPTRNNGLHLRVRACVANFIMAHLEEFKI